MQGLVAFQRYFDFAGRSGRAEYWQFIGLYLLALAVGYVLDLALSGPHETPTFTVLVVLICIVPAYAATVRRLHDRGRTGKWVIAQLGLAISSVILLAALERSRYTAAGDVLLILARAVSVTNFGFSVYILVQLVLRGDAGSNEYGADPMSSPIAAPTLQGLSSWARPAASSGSSTAAQNRKSPPAGDPLEQIERLAKMRDAGMLTDDEFQAQKASYLGRL